MEKIKKNLIYGFTLLEILVVIAIIVTLIGIGIPAYNSWRNRGQIERAKATISKLEMAVEMYRTDFGEYPSTLIALKDAEVSGNCPYIDNKDYRTTDRTFRDPWNSVYGYMRYTPNIESVTITSNGPDTIPSGDDISNISHGG